VNRWRLLAGGAAAEMGAPPPRARHYVSTPNSSPLKHLLLYTPHTKTHDP